MIEALQTNGRMVDRPWMLATGARCRSLELAACGHVADAAEMAEHALVHHERLPMPFERARAELNRVGSAARHELGLTPSEQRVAEL